MNSLRSAIRNPTAVARAFVLVVLVAGLLALNACRWLEAKLLPSDVALRVQYLEQYIDLAQVLIVGVVATLVSVILPLMLPGARDRFERYKESRQAYSRAKTAVIYLPDRVAQVGREEAFLLVESAHRELHLAETFEDVIIAKGYLKWFANPDLWILYNYWQIVAVAEVLRKYDWNAMENRDMRRARLRESLEPVHKRFGTRGEDCAGETWRLEHGAGDKRDPKDQRDLDGLSRFAEEDYVEGRIRAAIIGKG